MGVRKLDQQDQTAAAPQAVKRPPLKALFIILAAVFGFGAYGVMSLNAKIEMNTTNKDGEYVVGDCRIYEQDPGTGSHGKYRKAKMCLQEDGTWKVVETWTKKPKNDDSVLMEPTAPTASGDGSMPQ